MHTATTTLIVSLIVTLVKIQLISHVTHQVQVIIQSYFEMYVCTQLDNCTNGDVRLVDGETNNEGRIEYCYYGEWSILCSKSNLYGQTASNICHKLGYHLNSCKSVY